MRVGSWRHECPEIVTLYEQVGSVRASPRYDDRRVNAGSDAVRPLAKLRHVL